VARNAVNKQGASAGKAGRGKVRQDALALLPGLSKKFSKLFGYWRLLFVFLFILFPCN
jgi:hypothetical protein